MHGSNLNGTSHQTCLMKATAKREMQHPQMCVTRINRILTLHTTLSLRDPSDDPQFCLPPAIKPVMCATYLSQNDANLFVVVHCHRCPIGVQRGDASCWSASHIITGALPCGGHGHVRRQWSSVCTIVPQYGRCDR